MVIDTVKYKWKQKNQCSSKLNKYDTFSQDDMSAVSPSSSYSLISRIFRSESANVFLKNEKNTEKKRLNLNTLVKY